MSCGYVRVCVLECIPALREKSIYVYDDDVVKERGREMKSKARRLASGDVWVMENKCR